MEQQTQQASMEGAAQAALKSSAEYSMALLEALADFVLTDDEIESLCRIRKTHRLTEGQVRAVHASVVQWALGMFAGDGDLDEHEMMQLSMIIDCLRTLGWAPGDKDMGLLWRKKRASHEVEPSGVLIDRDGWYYREYIEGADLPSTIRVEQRKPGRWACRYSYCQVAGINIPQRASEVWRFFRGSYRWLALEREPDNLHDENAVRVTGVFREGEAQCKAQLGYVAREIAAELKGEKVADLWPRIRFLGYPDPYNENRFNLRFDIMGPE